jgi:hypothetical protein
LLLLVLVLVLQALGQECTLSTQTLLPSCGCCAGLYCCEFCCRHISN